METLLILDDDKRRHQMFSQNYRTVEYKDGETVNNDLVHVFTSHDCIEVLKTRDFDYVFLDHDLGGKIMEESGPGTGYEVAKWIADNPERAPRKGVFIHSLNPVGGKNMFDVMTDLDIHIEVIPRLWTKKPLTE